MRFRTILIVLFSLPVTLYITFCGVLFFEQRQFIFAPTAIRLHQPPDGSGYQSLAVAVPGLGVLTDWWTPPASPAMPTVVFFHGNAADRTDFMSLGMLLHQHGWGVVLASYRGYSGNPGTPTEAGLLADARATIATVKPRAGRIIVWGHSLGSGVAAQMASEGLASGLVLESPYTSVADLGARQFPYIPVHLLSLDPFDTLSLLDRIRVPVLIFHSADDPEIPFAMGQELAERFGARASFVKMNGVGHYPHRQDLSGVVVQWATQKHLVGR